VGGLRPRDTTLLGAAPPARQCRHAFTARRHQVTSFHADAPISNASATPPACCHPFRYHYDFRFLHRIYAAHFHALPLRPVCRSYASTPPLYAVSSRQPDFIIHTSLVAMLPRAPLRSLFIEYFEFLQIDDITTSSPRCCGARLHAATLTRDDESIFLEDACLRCHSCLYFF